MADKGTETLYAAFNFHLEIEGVTGDAKQIVGGFKSVSGMDSTTEVIEFKQGNDVRVRKKPGRTTYSNIVLERGYAATEFEHAVAFPFMDRERCHSRLGLRLSTAALTGVANRQPAAHPTAGGLRRGDPRLRPGRPSQAAGWPPAAGAS